MNRLYNEDNLTTIDRFPDESIDLVITSPPYNVKLGGRSDESRSYDVYVDDKEYSVYISWLRVIFSKIFSKLTFGGRVVINIGGWEEWRDPNFFRYYSIYERYQIFDTDAYYLE